MAENNSNLFFHTLGSQEPEIKAKGVLRGNVTRIELCTPSSVGGCKCPVACGSISWWLLLPAHTSQRILFPAFKATLVVARGPTQIIQDDFFLRLVRSVLLVNPFPVQSQIQDGHVSLEGTPSHIESP